MPADTETQPKPSPPPALEASAFADAPFQLGAWRVEPDRNRIVRGEDVRDLQPLLIELLVYLFAHRGRVVTREEILENVWTSPHVTPHALSNAVSKLRKALGDDSADQSYIKTKRGVGYRLVAKAASAAGGQTAPRLALLVDAFRAHPRQVAAAALALFLVAGGVIYYIARKQQVEMVYKGDVDTAIESLELDGWSVDKKKPEED